MQQFVVYKNPTDYPGKFVVRRFVISLGAFTADPVPLIVCENIEEARESIPEWAAMICRDPNDAPAIQEVWL